MEKKITISLIHVIVLALLLIMLGSSNVKATNFDIERDCGTAEMEKRYKEEQESNTLLESVEEDIRILKENSEEKFIEKECGDGAIAKMYVEAEEPYIVIEPARRIYKCCNN